MRPTPLLAALGAAALLTVGACAGAGGAKSEDDIRDSLSEHFQTNGLSEDQADCYAELVIEEVGVDELKDAQVGDEEPPAAQQEAYATAATRAVDECDIDEASVSG